MHVNFIHRYSDFSFLINNVACLHSWFVSNDSWSFLDRFMWRHSKCIVWVYSLFSLGSIDARTWRGYGLYGPRMGPTDNFSLVTGPAGKQTSSVNDVIHYQCMIDRTLHVRKMSGIFLEKFRKVSDIQFFRKTYNPRDKCQILVPKWKFSG